VAAGDRSRPSEETGSQYRAQAGPLVIEAPVVVLGEQAAELVFQPR